jgi:hypothetical protein
MNRCRVAGAGLPAGFRGFAKTLVPRPLSLLRLKTQTLDEDNKHQWLGWDSNPQHLWF